MAIRNSISLALSPAESEALDTLKAKGIRTIDVFRRGLEAYVADILGNGDEKKGA